MQLSDEFPAMIALFACGMVGYVSTRWLKSRVSSAPIKAAKLVDEPEEAAPCEFQHEAAQSPVTATPVSAATRRACRRHEKRLQKKRSSPVSAGDLASPTRELSAETAENEEQAAVTPAAEEEETPATAPHEPDAAEVQTLPQQQEVSEESCEHEQQLQEHAEESEELEEVSEEFREHEQQLQDHAEESEEQQLDVVVLEQQERQDEQDLPEDQEQLEAPEEERSELAPEPISGGTAPEVGEDTEFAEQPEEAVIGHEDSWPEPPAWSAKEEVQAQGAWPEEECMPDAETDASAAEWAETGHWSEAGWSSHSEEHYSASNSGSWKGRWWKETPEEQDDWMTPFDELIGGTSFTTPSSPAVCLWGSTRDGKEGGDSTPDVFTDGHKQYRTVPSADGTLLCTDGHQLYAAVCVFSPAPPSSA